MVSREIVVAVTGTQQRGGRWDWAETTADRVNPITGQARTICTPERSCVSGVIERIVRQQQQQEKKSDKNESSWPHFSLFSHPPWDGDSLSVFHLRHNQTLSPLQTEDSST